MFHDSSSKSSRAKISPFGLASKIFFAKIIITKIMFKKCCRNRLIKSFSLISFSIELNREIYILTWWAPVMAPTSRDLFLLGDYFH